MRPAVCVDYGCLRVCAHAASADFVIGRRLRICGVNFSIARFKNGPTPVFHVVMKLPILIGKLPVAARSRQTVLVYIFGIEIDVAVSIRESSPDSR